MQKLSVENVHQLQQAAVLGKGSIHQIVWLPDGSGFMAAGTQGLWHYQIKQGKVIARELPNHNGETSVIAVSADGRYLASCASHADDTGSIRLWEAPFQASTTIFNDFWSSSWACIVFSPDSRFFAASELANDRLFIYNLEQAQEHDFYTTTEVIVKLCFSPDSHYLALGGLKGGLYVSNINTKDSIFHAITPMLEEVKFSPDGQWLAFCDDSGGWLYHFATQQLHRLSEIDCWHIEFSTDGSFIAYDLDRKTIEIREVANQKIVATLQTEGKADWMNFCFNPDGSLTWTSGDGKLHIWDIQRNKAAKALSNKEGGFITMMSAHPSNQLLALYRQSGELEVWSLEKRRKLTLKEEFVPSTFGMAFSPVSKILALYGSDRVIRLWDTATGTLIRSFASQFRAKPFTAGYLTFLKNQPNKLLSCFREDCHVSLFDWETGVEEYWFTAPAKFKTIRVSPDERYLIAAGQKLYIWNLQTRKLLWALPIPADIGLSFSPDGEYLITAPHWGKRICLIHLATGEFQEFNPQLLGEGILHFAMNQQWERFIFQDSNQKWDLYSLDAPQGQFTQIASLPLGTLSKYHTVFFSPTQNVFAAVDYGAYIQIYNSNTGEFLHKIKPENRQLRLSAAFRPYHEAYASFSPDGTLFALAAERNMVIVESETGKVLIRLPLQEANAGFCQFSPDQTTLVVGHRTMILFQVPRMAA